jgi:PEP-CTERM motif-containing protein
VKHSLAFTLLLVALLSAPAFGNHLYLAPDCCGDNFAYTSGSLVLFGGTDPFFLDASGYMPGSTVGGSGSLYLYSTFLQVNGQNLEFFFTPGSIFMTPFTLPTNGSDFRALVYMYFSANGLNYETGLTTSVGGNSSGSISFYFSPVSGFYYPSSFVEAPEPGTLQLMGSGLVGIATLVRRRFHRA